MLLQIIGQIGQTPKPITIKFGLKKLGTSLYRLVQMCFDILNRLGVAHECDGQTTDRQTDITAVSNSAVYRRAPKIRTYLFIFNYKF